LFQTIGAFYAILHTLPVMMFVSIMFRRADAAKMGVLMGEEGEDDAEGKNTAAAVLSASLCCCTL
jgi:hypothetical protein